MKNIELTFLQFAIDKIVGLARPNGLDGDMNLSACLYLRIVDVNCLDKVAFSAQHPDFRFKAFILPTPKLVAIMQH